MAHARHLNAVRGPVDEVTVTMPTLPSLPPPTGPPPGEKAARRPSVEQITLAAVLVIVVLGTAGWFLLKPASSSSTAARPRTGSSATAATPTAPTVTPTAATVRPTATTAVHKPAKGKALTQVAYLKAGNAVCAALTRSITKLALSPAGKPAAGYVTKVVQLVEGAQVRLGKLRAPAKDAPQWQKIRAMVAHQLVLDRQYATALAQGDEQRLISLTTSVNAAQAQTAAAFRAYGLTACG
jgi:hypothetical protein